MPTPANVHRHRIPRAVLNWDSPGQGEDVDVMVRKLTDGLLAAGKRAGLEVCDRTEMERMEQTRRGVRITTKSGFVITARRAVIAAGF